MYTCPMHPEVTSEKQGSCSLCGMKLVKATALKARPAPNEESYRPLIIILALILSVTIALAIRDVITNSFLVSSVMMHFMAGFFLVFSGFKLIDVNGFADGYAMYDLLAMRWFSYGRMYPFLEFILGLLYAVGIVSPIVLFLTFILMTFSGAGVARKLLRHEKFQCACLGTFLKVPLTKVTLIEDFGMAIMALLMFVLH